MNIKTFNYLGEASVNEVFRVIVALDTGHSLLFSQTGTRIEVPSNKLKLGSQYIVTPERTLVSVAEQEDYTKAQEKMKLDAIFSKARNVIEKGLRHPRKDRKAKPVETDPLSKFRKKPSLSGASK